MPQGLSEYSGKPKFDWRGWFWNRTVGRLEEMGIPLDKATVVYLPGPEDKDRMRASEKGFRPENLIAVDKEKEHVDRVRSNGGIAVHGDLIKVLEAWPHDWKVNAILADFCAGLNLDAMSLPVLLDAHPALGMTTVTGVNLQRGRDPRSNFVREALDELYEDGQPPTHRGKQFVRYCGFYISSRVSDQKKGFSTTKAITQNLFPGWTNAAYKSYRGSNVYMDSAVFTWPLPSHQGAWSEIEPDDEYRKKVTACRAVRTRRARQNGREPWGMEGFLSCLSEERVTINGLAFD